MTGNHIVNLVMSSYNALDMKMESKLYNLNYELCASVTVSYFVHCDRRTSSILDTILKPNICNLKDVTEGCPSYPQNVVARKISETCGYLPSLLMLAVLR